MISTEQLNNLLEQYTWEGKWEKVILMYYKFPKLHTEVFIKLNGTALHVAIDLHKEYVVKELLNAILTQNIDDRGDHQWVEALEKGNERGDTPLHVAATRGFARICKWIIGINNERIYLLSIKNKRGETPLFQAAVNWREQAFVYLSRISNWKATLPDLVRDDDGDNILHAAIRGEYFDLALIIVHYYDFLSTQSNIEQSTPLKVLATRPSSFKSASELSWYKRIIYHCIYVEQLDVERIIKSNLRKMEANQNSNKKKFSDNNTGTGENIAKQMKQFDEENIEMLLDLKNPSNLEKHEDRFLPLNYETFQQFVESAYVHILGLLKKKKQPDVENPSNDNRPPFKSEKSEKHQVGFFPPNYKTFQQFVKSAYFHIRGLSGIGVKDVKIAKKKHEWSSQLLKALMKRPYESFTGGGDKPTDRPIDIEIPPWEKFGITNRMKSKEQNENENEKQGTKSENKKQGTKSENENDEKDTALLVAARNGIVEIVNEILTKIPSAIHNINSKKENVLHVAVKYRQPVVVETLRKLSDTEVWKNMVLAVDEDENTILHLAAHVLGEDKPLQMAGSALQMMWDIKWFQYIRSLVPQHFYFISNNIKPDNTSQTPGNQTPPNQTPGEIFRSKHATLITDSSEWLKGTSESCSVVAALVAGVSFATASAVPGGTTDEGTPILEGKPAFDIFAISSLVGLCFSVTGLIMFLSILTSRKQANDFRRDLPMKLLFGLTSLFVAIASLFVSFCTGHFFLLNHRYKSVMYPLYGATCIPVTFYAVAQFPLYYDLLTAILPKIPVATVQGDKL